MSDPFFHPVSGFDLPRFAGIPTFMRLPHIAPDHPRFAEVEVGLIGVPWDGGTTNRPGPRHGPRQLRDASTMIRAGHGASGVRPFEAMACADLGDVGPNPADLADSMARVTDFYRRVVAAGIFPLTAGGDHLCSLPILRAVAADGPLGMIHFDSHTDLFDSYFGGTKYTHGTPFRRASEDGYLDRTASMHVGTRGPLYGTQDLDDDARFGFGIISSADIYRLGVDRVVEILRERIGDRPLYLSLDIDVLDPAHAPGTGTPEAGGATSREILEIIRGFRGMNVVGAEVVEVSPPYDHAELTGIAAAHIVYEFISLMALGAGAEAGGPAYGEAGNVYGQPKQSGK